MLKLISAAVLCLSGLSFSAGATVILSADPVSPDGPGFIVSQNQWLGRRFVVDTTTTLTSIKGYIAAPASTFHISVWNIGSNLLPQQQLYSAQVQKTSNNPRVDWEGLTDLAWGVAPGTYYAVFSMEGSDYAPSPIYMPEAGEQSEVVSWRSAPIGWGPVVPNGTVRKGIGVEILGDEVAIPEPGSSMLFGIAGLAFFTMRLRHSDRKFTHRV
jgi:hypothetical protein